MYDDINGKIMNIGMIKQYIFQLKYYIIKLYS